MNIAVIPARGGSERIPFKNIKQFCGKPMIAYPIETAFSSKYIDKVVVSTDNDEIEKISLEYGAHVPFKRPSELSDNFTPTVPVISHAIKMLSELGWEIDSVCCIYPCTPLLDYRVVEYVYEKFISQDIDYAYPVLHYPHPVQRAMRMSDAGKMEFIYLDYELTRTQDLEETFHDAGQFYWGTADAWSNEKMMHTDGIGVNIKSWEVVDIDTEEDWIKAEMLKNNKRNKLGNQYDKKRKLYK